VRDDADCNNENYQTMLGKFRGSGKGEVLGTLVTENQRLTGDFACAWIFSLASKALGLTLTVSEITPGLASALVCKDKYEQTFCKRACAITALGFRINFVPQMEEVVNQGHDSTVTHGQLSEQLSENLEVCYPPTIQSGENCSLENHYQANLQLDRFRLSHDVILSSFGVRVKNYCSNAGRTYFIDPVKTVKEAYIHLKQCQEKLLKMIQPGSQLVFY
jgi:Xaa-Pro aminopeptidase